MNVHPTIRIYHDHSPTSTDHGSSSGPPYLVVLNETSIDLPASRDIPVDLGLLYETHSYLRSQISHPIYGLLQFNRPNKYLKRLYQSNKESSVSGVLFPNVESLQIEDVNMIKQPELMPVLSEVVTLHAGVQCT